MSSNHIFSSKTDPIPGIRRNIEIIPVRDNGQAYLYFHDNLGYATPDFVLDQRAAPVLSLIDGSKSIRDLSPYLGEDVTEDQLLEYIQFLDKNRLLHSRHYREYAEGIEQDYEESDTHNSVTSGFSYPSDPAELKDYLDKAFSEIEPETPPRETAKALYAPHIDPRVGMQSYAKAFSAVRNITPERVVILATSHYAGLYRGTYQNEPFIVTKKNFEMPLGTIQADTSAIEALLSQKEQTGITARDRAHRIEHSIELPLLFMHYLWDHDFSIVPILVSGLDDLMYLQNGYRAKQVDAFGNQLQELFGGDDTTFFLISGDLAHVGKKFGDQQPAREMFNEVKQFDERFLQHARQAAPEALLELVSEKYDPYRICGFPPLYTFLKGMTGIKGETLSYDVWDESERDSAVSFGSILYWSTGKANGTDFRR